MLTELSEENARQVLSEQTVARLGCVLQSGEPYVVPVNYFYRDDAVYCHSLEGLKLAALRENPKACVQVDTIENSFKWHSVIAFGEFEEITDEREREEYLKEFAGRFQGLTPVEAVKRRNDENPEIVLFCVRIKRISGLAES